MNVTFMSNGSAGRGADAVGRGCGCGGHRRGQRHRGRAGPQVRRRRRPGRGQRPERRCRAHRGLTVQALCPMGVRTAMLDGITPAAELILGETAITTEEVADAVMAGIASGSFLILPHPDVARMYANRAADTDRWLRGMNKLQTRTETA